MCMQYVFVLVRDLQKTSQDFHLCDLSIEYWGGIECLVLSQKAKRNRLVHFYTAWAKK